VSEEEGGGESARHAWLGAARQVCAEPRSRLEARFEPRCGARAAAERAPTEAM